MRILVDDVRSLDFVDIIFRNAEAFEGYYNLRMEQLWKGPPTDTLILDHDLGECETGAYCLNLLRDALVYDNIMFTPLIGLISSNPVGRKMMQDTLIHDMGYDFMQKHYFGAYEIYYYSRGK